MMLCRGPGPAWLVVYCQAKAELTTRDEIVRSGYQAWTPLERCTVKRRGKRVEVERPYFPRYCFAGVDVHRQDWQALLDLDGVEDVLRNNNEPMCVPTTIIERLKRLEEIGAFDSTKPTPNGYAIGETVRVGDGQFSGFRGIIEEFMARMKSASASKRAKVLVEFMGRMTRIEVPVEHLEKV